MDYATHDQIQGPAGRSGQSILGISSFILSIFFGLTLLALVVSAAVMAAEAPSGELDEESAAAVMIGLGLIFSLFAELVALGLGIGGVFQRTKGRAFAIAGICISAAMFLSILGLIVIGLTMG